MKSKSFVLMIVSLGFGLVAAIGISQVMGSKGGTAPEIPKRKVLIAAVDLEHNSLLTEQNVVVDEWPMEIIPENTAESVEQIKEMVSLQALAKGMPINLTNLIHEKNMGKIVIPDGFAVISMKVSAEDTIYGMLRPGDKVNMIGHIRGKPAKTFLRGLRVFSVDAKMTSNGVGREEGGAGGDAVVGILANERQSELIMQVQKEGSIKLVLRGDNVQVEEENAMDQEGLVGLGLFLPEPGLNPAPVANTTPSPTLTSMFYQPKASKTMKVWTQDGMELVTFRDGAAVSPGPIDRHRPAATPSPQGPAGGTNSDPSKVRESDEDPQLNSDDTEESETYDEYERGLEEGQY